MEKQAKTFARDATGLVKTLGFLDQFVVSQAIIVVVNEFVLTFFFAPVFSPGANLTLVFILGSIPAFAMSFVYSKMVAGMPRSVGTTSGQPEYSDPCSEASNSSSFYSQP